MSRQAKLLIITHGYALFAAAELQFGYQLLGSMLDELLFNIMPGLFIILVIVEWIKTSTIKLSLHEKRSLRYFVITMVTFHLYYCICTVMNAMDNRPWVQAHNWILVFFIIFTFIFYLIVYYSERK